MAKKPSETAEDLARRLQEKLRHERPRWHRWAPLLAVTLLVALGILVWALYPVPDPPRLTVTALDVLSVKDEPVLARACLDPLDDDAKVDARKGQDIIFWIERGRPVRDDEAAAHVACDEHGQATATLKASADTSMGYHVRHADAHKKQDAPKDRARVHVVAKEAPVLVVDVEETLADLDPKLWTKTNPLNIGVRAGAGAALKAAHTKLGYHIVYLAVGNAPAKEYRRVRGWVGLKANARDALPAGAVLGRLQYDSATTGEARLALLSDLRQRLAGPLVAVVRTSEAAEQCLQLGIRAIAMGGGDFPAKITRIQAWQELPAVLAQ